MYAALDIGGTKIAGALIDEEGSVIRRAELPTPAGESTARMAGTVDAVIDELAAHPAWGTVSGLGIASAGPVDTAAGTVSPVNIPSWRAFPLVDSVRAHPMLFDGIEPVLLGDAVAVAAAEHWLGAARGLDNALCMVVSTGVGGGFVLNGRLHPGPSGNAGHIGHISVDLDGPPCACGARGCVEGYASGTAIARHAVQSGWRPPAGAEATAAAVAAAARAGDERALASYDRSAKALAAAIAGSATLLEIEVCVIGGGVAQAGDVLFSPLRRHLRAFAALGFTRGLEVRPAALARDAGLVGAAAAARLQAHAAGAPAVTG
ncbi:ROK family transcriptional regulator [Streptomyces toyocaensis]|uniref:ROK family transcriptional regulator n=1 Tax=Streptomyces toyocaensis TaxID=55952 RepID=A0A081XWA9_STRTO|nr:ROK family protein [Streptomyces toyocaensis]KES07832.1 ROK family transcriptional regulator [Streptomyces toyocaensis]